MCCVLHALCSRPQHANAREHGLWSRHTSRISPTPRRGACGTTATKGGLRWHHEAALGVTCVCEWVGGWDVSAVQSKPADHASHDHVSHVIVVRWRVRCDGHRSGSCTCTGLQRDTCQTVAGVCWCVCERSCIAPSFCLEKRITPPVLCSRCREPGGLVGRCGKKLSSEHTHTPIARF